MVSDDALLEQLTDFKNKLNDTDAEKHFRQVDDDGGLSRIVILSVERSLTRPRSGAPPAEDVSALVVEPGTANALSCDTDCLYFVDF